MWRYGPKQIGYKYLGAGNPMDNGDPYNELDAYALRHDKAYQKYGTSAYFRNSDADDAFIAGSGGGVLGTFARSLFRAKRFANDVFVPFSNLTKFVSSEEKPTMPDKEFSDLFSSVINNMRNGKHSNFVRLPKKKNKRTRRKKQSITQKVLQMLNPPQQSMQSIHIAYAIPKDQKWYINAGNSVALMTAAPLHYMGTLIIDNSIINCLGSIQPMAQYWITQFTRTTEVTNCSQQTAYIKLHKFVPLCDHNLTITNLVWNVLNNPTIVNSFPNFATADTRDYDVTAGNLAVGFTVKVLSHVFTNPDVMRYVKKYFRYSCSAVRELAPEGQFMFKQQLKKPYLYDNYDTIIGAAQPEFIKNRTEVILVEVVGPTTRGGASGAAVAGTHVTASPLTIDISYNDVFKVVNRPTNRATYRNFSSIIDPAPAAQVFDVTGANATPIL